MKVTVKEPIQFVEAGNVWGTINGTLSDQVDLQEELDLRVPYTGATSDIDLGSTYKITNMVNPSNDFDAATKNYVDFSIFSIPPDPTKWTIGGDAGSLATLTFGTIDDSQISFLQNGISFLSIRYSDALFSLNNAIGDPRFDILANVIYDDANTVSVTFNERKLVSQSGVDLLEFSNDVFIRDTTGDMSFESTQRNLFYSVASGGNIAYKWENEIFFAPAGDTRMDLSVQEIYFNDQLRIKWLNDGAQIGPNLAVGTGINVGDATIHQNAGTATATYHKFTAGTTTGISVSDGFDIGITASGVAELRQRENLALEIYTTNTMRAQWTGAGNLFLGGTVQARGAAGSAAVPFWGFETSSDCGMYRPSGSSIAFSTSGTARLSIDSAGKTTIYQGTTLRGAMTTVYSQINSVGNVGVGEDNLHSTSIPSGGFALNGDCMEVNASGTFAANANNKRVKLKFGAITLFDTAALAFNTGDWEISARIFRTATTTGKSVVTWTCNNATLTTTVDYQSWAFNFLTANTLVVTGEATSNNDIVQETMQVFWIPVA